MGKLYLVICKADGHVSYGVDCTVSICGAFSTKEAADTVVNKYRSRWKSDHDIYKDLHEQRDKLLWEAIAEYEKIEENDHSYQRDCREAQFIDNYIKEHFDPEKEALSDKLFRLYPCFDFDTCDKYTLYYDVLEIDSDVEMNRIIGYASYME